MNWAFHSSERTCLRLAFSVHQSLKVNALVPSYLHWAVTQHRMYNEMWYSQGNQHLWGSENSTKLNFKKMHIIVLFTCAVPCDITPHHVMSLKPWFWAHTRYALHWACHHTSQHNQLCVSLAHIQNHCMLRTCVFLLHTPPSVLS